MTAEGVRWRPIVVDLALHLGSACALEQARAILDEAERDLARLQHPADFWDSVAREYERIAASRQRLAGEGGEDLSQRVRALIATMRAK